MSPPKQFERLQLAEPQSDPPLVQKIFEFFPEKCLKAAQSGYNRLASAQLCPFNENEAINFSMPSRHETAQRKSALLQDLRKIQREGRARPGEIALSQRELGQRYGLSGGLVGQVLQTLVDEGVLYSIPRVGTFIGAPPSDAFEFFLFLFPHHQTSEPNSFFGALQSGFEEVIAGRGGASLTMTKRDALEAHQRGELPPVAGYFSLVPPPDELIARLPGAGRVCFESDEAPGFDIVGFDNVGGGRLASQHLLKQGHKRIAFLGVHGSDALPQWSWQRETGWREALEEAGYPAPELAWHPESGEAEFPHTIAEQTDYAARIAARYVAGPRGLECGGRSVSAVVAINAAATSGLLSALRAAGAAPSKWPAIVSFGNTPEASGHVFTSLQMPWDEVGRSAAKLLWARRTHELSGPPVEREVSMRLIPRLTCRTDWSTAPGHAALAIL